MLHNSYIERVIRKRNNAIEEANYYIDNFLFFWLWRFLNCKRKDNSLTFIKIYNQIAKDYFESMELLIELERRFHLCLEMLEVQKIIEEEINKEHFIKSYSYLKSILEN